MHQLQWIATVCDRVLKRSNNQGSLESRMFGNLQVRFGVGAGVKSPGPHHASFVRRQLAEVKKTSARKRMGAGCFGRLTETHGRAKNSMGSGQQVGPLPTGIQQILSLSRCSICHSK